MTAAFTLLLLLFSSLQSGDGGGIVYGEDHAFIVEAPDGWILDNSSGASLGLHAVFYPEGSSWAESAVVMYVNTASKEPPHETIKELMEYDLARLREHSPDVRVETGDTIKTDDGKLAEVRRLSGDTWGNFESIAYIEDETVLVLIVLSSRDEPSYKRSQAAFASLVSSYYFITSEVTIEK